MDSVKLVFILKVLCDINLDPDSETNYTSYCSKKWITTFLTVSFLEEGIGIKELSALLLHILHVFPPLQHDLKSPNLGFKEYAVCRFF